ncbi:MAG: energy transducer TonB [Bacteroidales bacterium]|nr:energy transducer TonB [Bacteroidales bacterium]
MKTIIFLFCTILLFNNLLKAQNSDAGDIAVNNEEKPELKVNELKEINFIELYEINTKLVKKAKTLGEAIIRTEPEASSNMLDIIIPKGAIVETYKYFPKEAVWIVKYNNSWGFVSATMIMPVQEKKQASNFTPYDEAPKLLSRIKLKYPKEANQNGIEGKVIVKLLISKTGAVKETEVIKSIPELDNAAIDAVKKLKFKPAKYKGKVVDVWVRLPINFEIEKF